MRTTYTVLVGLAAIGSIQAQPHSAGCSTRSTAQPAATAGADEQLSRDAYSAPTAIKRFQRLFVEGEGLRTEEALRERIVFDFNGAQPASGAAGGATKAATAETFPFSAGFDIGMTVGFLEPCGINTPHVHPRATEFFLVVQGSNVRFGSILENGLVESGRNQEIGGTLGQLEATLFPQGSIHWQFNDGCNSAVFVAAFDSSDPGTSTIAQNFFGLNAGVVNATLGFPRSIDGRNIEEFRALIPVSLAQNVDNCLARCSE